MENEILKENFNKGVNVISEVWWLRDRLGDLISLWNENWEIPICDDEMYTYDQKFKKLPKRTQKYQDKVKKDIERMINGFLENFPYIEEEMERFKKEMEEMKEYNKNLINN